MLRSRAFLARARISSFFLLFTALNEAFEVNEKKKNLCRKSESEPTGFQKAGAEDD